MPRKEVGSLQPFGEVVCKFRLADGRAGTLTCYHDTPDDVLQPHWGGTDNDRSYDPRFCYLLTLPGRELRLVAADDEARSGDVQLRRRRPKHDFETCKVYEMTQAPL